MESGASDYNMDSDEIARFFAAVTLWLRKCLSTKPFSAISPFLFGYSRDFV